MSHLLRIVLHLRLGALWGLSLLLRLSLRLDYVFVSVVRESSVLLAVAVSRFFAALWLLYIVLTTASGIYVVASVRVALRLARLTTVVLLLVVIMCRICLVVIERSLGM